MLKSAGFSIVELIIVMAILATVLAIAAPNFNRYRDNANLKEAARDIESDIKLYKQKAVSENIDYRIVFNVGANTYTVQNRPEATWINVETKTVGKGSDGIKIISSSFVSSTVNFQTRGMTNGGSVGIQHSRSSSTALIVVSLMGRVRVEYDLK